MLETQIELSFELASVVTSLAFVLTVKIFDNYENI